MKFIKSLSLLAFVVAFCGTTAQAQDASAPKRPSKPLSRVKLGPASSASTAPASEQSPTGGVKAPPPPPVPPKSTETKPPAAPTPPQNSTDVKATPAAPANPSAKRPTKRPANPRAAVQRSNVLGGGQAAPVGKAKLEGTRQVKKSNTRDTPVGGQHQ